MFSKRFSHLSAILCACAFLLYACAPKDDRLRLVCVIDLTSSIEAEAQQEALASLQSALARLRRGDSVTVIPITGDAMNEAQGRALRFRLSERREAYDADLRRTVKEITARLRQMRDEVADKPFSRSDLLGAVALAAEEISGADRRDRIAVIVLSDLLQDDSQYDFKRDARMASGQAATRFAELLASQRAKAFEGADVYIGLLRSLDLKGLPQPRRDAVRAFWEGYFRAQGAGNVRFATDGSGRLAEFIERSKADTDAIAD